MTPKEKVNELVEKMLGDNNHYLNQNIEIDKLIAKQCALICVDEMLQVLWHNHEKNSEKMYRYYLEVKQELLKL